MKTIEVCAAVLKNKNHQILTTQRMGGEFDGYWEFPGGKMEAGETHHDTLIRELKEELDVSITVDDFITTVNYDYPTFKLVMHTYWCRITEGDINLLVHSAAKWINRNQLDSVNWLAADVDIINILRKTMTL